MKKHITSLVILMISLFSITGCAHNEAVLQEQTTLCAYIKEIDGNTVTVDIAEYLTLESEARISELKLSEHDMPSGYYIHNPEVALATYILTEDTIYNFIDWGNNFVEKGADQNISTTNIEMFKQYLETYENAEPGMPFFFEVYEDVVISITEKPLM